MRLNLVDRREASAIHVHAGHILVADKHRTLNTGWRSVPLELIRRYSRGDQRLCLSCSAGSNQRQHRKEDVSLHIVRPPITPCLADLRAQYALPRAETGHSVSTMPRAHQNTNRTEAAYQENFRVFRPCRSLTSRPASVNLPKPEVRGPCQVNSIGRWMRARRSFTSVISCPPSLRCGQTSCSTALRLSP